MKSSRLSALQMQSLLSLLLPLPAHALCPCAGLSFLCCGVDIPSGQIELPSLGRTTGRPPPLPLLRHRPTAAARSRTITRTQTLRPGVLCTDGCSLPGDRFNPTQCAQWLHLLTLSVLCCVFVTQPLLVSGALLWSLPVSRGLDVEPGLHSGDT